jgi:hypothetical protein
MSNGRYSWIFSTDTSMSLMKTNLRFLLEDLVTQRGLVLEVVKGRRSRYCSNFLKNNQLVLNEHCGLVY